MSGTNIAAIAGAYLIGGLPAGLLIARARGIDDIREYGSGNIGASNVLRTLGVPTGLLVFAIDCFGKGMLPILIGRYYLGIEGMWLVVIGLGAVVGHCYSPYLKLTGGKGVATSLGVLSGLFWPAAVCSLLVFIVVVATTRYISLGSLLGSVTAPLWLLVWRPYLHQYASAYALITAAIAMLIIIRHQGNIYRLVSGTERKIGQRVETGQEDGAEEGRNDE